MDIALNSMAFSCLFPTINLHLKPCCSARPYPDSSKRHFTSKNPKYKKLKLRNYPPPTSLSTTEDGGEATTFICLPPKEDFYLDDSASLLLPEVIKLSDSKSTINRTRKFDKKIEEGSGLRNEDGEGNSQSSYKGFEFYEVNPDSGDEEEDTGINKKAGFDYGKFELYELSSDSEYREEDEPDDGKDDEMEFGNGEEEIKEKEKGVPAVMRCFDRTKIFVRSGDGGNGVVAFRREKFVPLGGPSGGDGGRGGNVFVEVDETMNSLLPFRKSLHFRAGRGGHGKGQQRTGPKGEDVVIKVPPGTVVRETDGDVLFEVLHPGQKALLLPGGRGGRGNLSFKSGTNKVPKIAENGEEGTEMWIELELKLVADVGIIGVPNAGKSTFLSVISAAKPEIANYPFTTLLPNLGVVSFNYDATMVVADLPGLLEGAHRGFGLGHEFLRHTERCLILVHIIDGSSQQPEYEFDAVRLELEMFSPELAEKPFVVAYNKMDLPEAFENWPSFQEMLQARGIKAFCISAVTREGTQDVIRSAYDLVLERKKENKNEGLMDLMNFNHVADKLQRQRAAPINEFEISRDSNTKEWLVDGAGLQRFVQMTNWRYEDSERRFQHVLDACGVTKSLKKLGVKEGDTVIIGEMEMEWHDSSDISGPTKRKKLAAEKIE